MRDCAKASAGAAKRAATKVLPSLAVLAVYLGFSSLSLAQSDPNICLGADFDAKHPIVVAKISGGSRVNFIKGSDEAASCPANTDACRERAYLVPGDLVLDGAKQKAFTCVAYQSPLARKQDWKNAWIATAALSPVAPMSAPEVADWVGSWVHAGGHVSISTGSRGSLVIQGEQVYPAAQSVHNGVISAEVRPAKGMIAFAEDGTIPFDEAEDGQCLVRMRRIGPWLLVEDNAECGGIMVTFTGLYRRKGN